MTKQNLIPCLALLTACACSRPATKPAPDALDLVSGESAPKWEYYSPGAVHFTLPSATGKPQQFQIEPTDGPIYVDTGTVTVLIKQGECRRFTDDGKGHYSSAPCKEAHLMSLFDDETGLILFRCGTVNTPFLWMPRADGKCYEEDAPKGTAK